MRCAALFSLALILPQPGLAQTTSPDTRLGQFFGQQACAFGPDTMERAQEAGFTKPEVTAWLATTTAFAGTGQSGDWLVIGPEYCTILMPHIKAELSFTDPDVAALVSGPEGAGVDSGPGCFIGYGGDMVQALMKSRGWDETKAYGAYVRLIAAGIIAGEVGFYGEDLMQTPFSLRYIGPGCDTGAGVAEIRASHMFLLRNFDQVIRVTGSYIPCKASETLMSGWLGPVQKGFADQGAKNVWLGLELLFISLAADWQQGWEHAEKGLPRPPLCRERPLEMDWSQME